MAATAKKTTKKSRSKELKAAPPVEDGCYSLAMTSDEIASTMQVLVFAKNIFEKMSEDQFKEGNSKAAEVYAARSALSLVLFEKFQSVVSIGEPISREFH